MRPPRAGVAKTPEPRVRAACRTLVGLARARRALLGGCGLPGTIRNRRHAADRGAASRRRRRCRRCIFPQDEAPHHDLTEWWYYTGHYDRARRAGRHARIWL